MWVSIDDYSEMSLGVYFIDSILGFSGLRVGTFLFFSILVAKCDDYFFKNVGYSITGTVEIWVVEDGDTVLEFVGQKYWMFDLDNYWILIRGGEKKNKKDEFIKNILKVGY